jgi:hypothetical protein
MATSPLDPSNNEVRNDRVLHRGHGTRALGPSDSSDSGSDTVGAAGGLDDSELDSDSDRSGTGERASASGSTPEGADIAPDHIERVDGADDDENDDEESEDGKE